MSDNALEQTDNLYFKILLIVFLVFAIGLKLNILVKSDIILPDEAAIILGAQGLKNTALYFVERPKTPFKTYIEEKGGYIHKTAKPFYVFLLSIVMLIFGDNLLIIKLVPLILSFINAFLVYKLIRKRQDSVIAGSGAITFLLMPYVLVYGSASLYTSCIWLFVLAGAYWLLSNKPHISLYPKLSWLYNSRKIVSNVFLIYADEQNTNGIKFVIFDNYNARYDQKKISGILTKIHFPNILLFDLYHTTSDFKKKIDIYKRQ